MNPVQSDLDELEEIPVGMSKVVAHDLEVSGRSVAVLVEQTSLVSGSEAFDIDRVASHESPNLDAGFRRLGKGTPCRVGCEKAADGKPFDVARRIIRRNANDDRLLPLAGHLIPEGGLVDRARIDDAREIGRAHV